MVVPCARTRKARIAAGRYVGVRGIVQSNVAGVAAMINETIGFIESLIVERRYDAELQEGGTDKIQRLRRMWRKRPAHSSAV